MNHPHARTVLQAVQRHPHAMSPILLEYMLRGEVIGRMAEKGLTESPLHGALAEEPNWVVAEGIMACLAAGWIARSGGFYPALRLTPQGEAQLAVAAATACHEAAPELSYRAYHRWRNPINTLKVA